MALDPILDSIDSLPDAVREHYSPGSGDQDGKFVLDVNKLGGFELANTQNLLNALSTEREGHKTAKRALEAFGDITADQARDALEKAKGAKDWGQREKQLIDTHNAETAKLRGEAESLRESFKTDRKRSVATEAINQAKGKVKLLLPFVEERLRVSQNSDGDWITEVLNQDGAAMIDSQGRPASPEVLMDEFRKSELFQGLFDGSGASGSGAVGGQPGSDRQAHVLSKEQQTDPNAYARAKEAADKAGVPIQLAD